MRLLGTPEMTPRRSFTQVYVPCSEGSPPFQKDTVNPNILGNLAKAAIDNLV